MWSNQIVHPGFLQFQFHFLTSAGSSREIKKEVGGKEGHPWAPCDWGNRLPQPGKQEIHGFHLLAIHFDVGYIVLKDGRHVDLWKLIFAEDNEEAGLPTGTVTHNHQLLSDRSHG